MYKLTSWLPVLRDETWLPILAQAETVVENSWKAAEKFGSGNDSMRLGMVMVAGAVAFGFLFYRLWASQENNIKELKARLLQLEEELRNIHDAHEKRYEALQNHYQSLTQGYWGVLNKLVTEFSSLNRVLENREIIARRPIEPEQLPPPPSQSPMPRASFMPAGPRRVPRRKENEDQ